MGHDDFRTWRLQDAKARFSELVRDAQAAGPQHVTVHGRKAVVVISEEDYECLKGARPGQVLVECLGGSPLKDVDFDHEPARGPVRNVEF